jgi:UDP-N-acetylglucosamine:LPS N-acetylglucosamine transferase
MKKAWVVAVDMGYGHQRAAYPLRDIAYERVITANSDKIVEPKEKRRWMRFQHSYEFMSRSTTIPIIGKFLLWILNGLERISPYYPFRDLSKPNLRSIYIHRLIRNNFGRSVVEYAKKKDIPFVSTFFVSADAAVHAGLKDVYCVVTDTDIGRMWVPEKPKEERIYYLTPTTHSTKRLMEYGVDKKDIFYTGFPLPEENLKTIKKDLGERLVKLDPKKEYISRFREVIEKEVKLRETKRPLTLTYAVGGAGAQKGIASVILKSLKNKILQHKIRINLIAGTRVEVNNYFLSLVKESGLEKELEKHVFVLCSLDKMNYFKEFNELLRTTDILWTKPSELSFYTALGLPIIISNPLGPHEEFNRDWLVKKNAGFVQEEPMFTNEWLFEWIDKGMLAEAAFNGYMKAPRYGTENIKKVIFAKDKSKVKLKGIDLAAFESG